MKMKRSKDKKAWRREVLKAARGPPTAAAAAAVLAVKALMVFYRYSLT
jgi:hypothetical protein